MLSTYLTNKEKVLKNIDDGDKKKKCVRGPKCLDIEEHMLTLFREVCNCNISIRGQLISCLLYTSRCV